MKKLYLVRHAKSSWDDPNLADQQRPLNRRGLKNAPEMGNRLADAGVNIDLIISSPAERAHRTACFLASAVEYEQDEIEIIDGLYFNGASQMLDIIQSTDHKIESLMLVAHNPDITEMLNRLCGYQVDNMPTCAIACVGFEGHWSDLDHDGGELLNYNIPKIPGGF